MCKNKYLKTMGILLIGLVIAGSATAMQRKGSKQASSKELVLFDGNGLGEWNQIGNANWKVRGSIIEADSGQGFLVSKRTFGDYKLTLDFFANKNSNSGVFMRCSDPRAISDKSCYEVNIFDSRPDQSGRTGAIVNVAPPKQIVNSEGHWNTMEITGKGSRLVVVLNGVLTVDTRDSKLKSGPIALQFHQGGIKFRNVRLTPLARTKTTSLQEHDIYGVWKLTKFVLTEEDGSEQNWCEGAYGTISYLPGKMTVSINCESTIPGSGAEKLGGLLFYSGPFEVDSKTNEVIHRVRNYSHESLKKVHRRKVEMDTPDKLRLVGLLGEGKEVIVEWDRQESFAYNAEPISGVWELVGSENEVQGSSETIPFCNGFYGSILYTPGGHVSVSINCGEKADEEIVEPADQFGRRYFYSGNYEVKDETVVQTPINASEVDQIGHSAFRKMSFDRDNLILEGTNGSKFRAIWKKSKSFVGLLSK